MAVLRWEHCKLIEPLGWFCYWTILVTVISVLATAGQVAPIPSSREDHSYRRYALAAVLTMSCILFFTSIAYEILNARGKTRLYGRKRPIDIVMHIITILAIIALMVSTVMLFIQIDKIIWPNTKSELEKCRMLGALNSDKTDTDPGFEEWKAYCAILSQYSEVGSLTLCDRIYEANKVKISTGTGRSRSETYRFKNDKRYCVTTDQFVGNIAGGVMALITVLSQTFLQGMIFNRMKHGVEETGQIPGQVHTVQTITTL